MIGMVRGHLVDVLSTGEAIIDVGGVGYRVIVAPTTLARLGDLGDTVALQTHLHVRDDALILYGFLTRDERQCFEALLGAHGVGPALALAILSVHPPDTLRHVVAEGDADALTLVPGVGKKTAARLLLELRSRLDVPEPAIVLDPAGSNGGSPRSDVREALTGLGYGLEEVREVLRELPAAGGPEDLLREALRRLAVQR